MEELLSLKWNNHRSTFLHILTILRDKQLYTDATLACEGRFYSVHRLVLSTCSDYFSAMFDRTTCKNPIIVLKDIKCEDLEALLDYMYLGEVNVRQADLASLIKAAECLRVKGLAVPDDEPPQKRGRGDNSNLRRSDGAGSPPSKRKRREEGQDGREDIRPGSSGGIGGGSGSSNSGNGSSSRPKSPQSQSRLSPQPPQQESSDSKSSPNSRLQGSETNMQGSNVPQSSVDGQSPYVKVEMEDTGGDDMGPGDNFNLNNDGYKEEQEDNDAGDPGGELSNDLPEFLQQASGSHMGGTSFGHGSFPGTSSFQSGDLAWQGEGSNLNFPGHLNYSSTETSSQNAPGGDHEFGEDNAGRVPTGWTGRQASSDSTLECPERSTACVTCYYCGRKFGGRNKKQNLAHHYMIHTGVKPFECPYCGHKSNRKGNLLCHIRSVHKLYHFKD